MGKAAISAVPNAVHYLKEHAPEDHARLCSAYPGPAEQAMLMEHMAPMAPLLRLQVESVVSALNHCIARWIKASPHLLARTNRANQWGLMGAILATLGSGSSISLLLGDAGNLAVAATATVGLIGGLVGLGERYLRRDALGGDDSLKVRHQALIAVASKASGFVRKLTPYLEINDAGEDPSDLKKSLDEADRTVVDMEQLLEGVPT